MNVLRQELSTLIHEIRQYADGLVRMEGEFMDDVADALRNITRGER